MAHIILIVLAAIMILAMAPIALVCVAYVWFVIWCLIREIWGGRNGK